MNVLVLNAGSSSLKFQLMNTKTREVFTKGNCEKIGLEEGIFGHSEGGEKVKGPSFYPTTARPFAWSSILSTSMASRWTPSAIVSSRAAGTSPILPR